MQQSGLDREATIQTVLRTLAKPEDYLCRVLGKMHACRRTHGRAVVRIGITGKGKYPSYRIEHTATLNDLCGNPIRHIEKGFLYGAFGGQSHNEFSDVEIQEVTWGGSYMSLEEVERLLGEFRANKKSKKIMPTGPKV